MPLVAERPYSMAAVPMPNRRNQKACSRFLQACTQRVSVRVLIRLSVLDTAWRKYSKTPYKICLLVKKKDIWRTVSDLVKHSWSRKTPFKDVSKIKACCRSSIFIFAPQMGGKSNNCYTFTFQSPRLLPSVRHFISTGALLPTKKGLSSRFRRI